MPCLEGCSCCPHVCWRCVSWPMCEPALAQAAAPAFDKGDTAWMIVATGLVFLMTIPGLALFYGGMVRKQNVLATLMQCFAICCLVSVLWMVIGYSLAFTPGTSLVGGLSRFFLRGLEPLSVHALAATIPETVFMMFQMSFAVITPALITGAFADRMKFSSLVVFIEPVEPAGLRSDRPLGLGPFRVALRPWRSRFRGRHGRSHQCRRCRSRGRIGDRQADGVSGRAVSCPTISCSACSVPACSGLAGSASMPAQPSRRVRAPAWRSQSRISPPPRPP